MKEQPKRAIYEEVFKAIMQIPYGKVESYGGIAGHIPFCTARMVGFALGHLEGPEDMPWHRVVNSQGRISSRGDGYSDELQRVLLEQEGVELVNGRVDMDRFRAQH